MDFKVGDKVIFLNETGGGTVSKILKNNIVQVNIGDGFEIPVLAGNILKAGGYDPVPNRGDTNAFDNAGYPGTDDGITPLYLVQDKSVQRQEGIYIAMIPEVSETPLVGSLEICLINHTKYYLLFSVFQNVSGDYKGEEYGFLQPESAIMLCVTGRSELHYWSNALLQCVFFEDGKTTPLAPFSGLIDFKPIQLYKEGNYNFETLINKKAFIVSVCRVSEHISKPLFENIITKEKLKVLQDKGLSRAGNKESPNVKRPILDQYMIDENTAEVDLHIGELTDDTASLTTGDVLQVQLEYFDKCINEAVTGKNKSSRIIFIHGVGNGKLKSEIYKRLQKITGVEYYDAPYLKYGMGATEIKFLKTKVN